MNRLAVLLTILAALPAAGAAAQGVQYTITDLGTLPGYSAESVATAINNNGQIVGCNVRVVRDRDLKAAGLGYYYATLDTSGTNTGALTIDSFPAGSTPGTFHGYFDVTFDIRYGSLSGPIVTEPAPSN